MKTNKPLESSIMNSSPGHLLVRGLNRRGLALSLHVGAVGLGADDLAERALAAAQEDVPRARAQGLSRQRRRVEPLMLAAVQLLLFHLH